MSAFTTTFCRKKNRKSRKPKKRGSSTIRALDIADFDSINSDDYQKYMEGQCVAELKESCKKAGIEMSDELIFRFACFHYFDQERAWIAIEEKHNDRHLKLLMRGKLVKQFESLTCFPLPGLKTKKNAHEVFYMRCSRHIPAKTDTSVLIDNMAYIMNSMSRTKEQCRNGIAFIIDMEHWTRKNMSSECSNRFMLAGQGDPVPTKVELMLIVNAPKIFKPTWKIFKHVMPKGFAKKIKFVKDLSRLDEYLMDGYERFLPFELNGWRCSTELVEDYIDMQRHEEVSKGKNQQAKPAEGTRLDFTGKLIKS